MAHKPIKHIVPGAKTAVILCHGIMGSPDHFRHFLPLIPADWSVCCLLLDGHGKGVMDFAHSSMKAWKAQVFTQLRELMDTHEQVIFVAHSMGTLFAFQAAVQYPDKIPQLFLLGSPTRPFVRPTTAVNSVLMALGYVNPKNKSAVDMRTCCSIRTDWMLWRYLLWIPRFLELFSEIHKTKKLLPQLKAPAWVYQSKKDELVAFSSCADFAGHPYITLTRLMDSGHFGYGPDDLKQLQTDFQTMLEKYR